MITISICNQKGGIGKTTTAAALHNALTFKGYKVLSIDVNAQRNLSQTFGATTDGITVKDILLTPAAIKDAIQTTGQGDIVAGSKDLANIDILQAEAGTQDKYKALKAGLKAIASKYDFCVIDSPPFMGSLLLNCLLASDYIVIVCEADAYSLGALDDIAENIQAVKGDNKRLQIAGILLTRYAGRATLTKQLTELFRDPAHSLGTEVFSTPIRENIAIKEAHIMRQSLYEYAPKSNAAQDYLAFTGELLERIERR